MNRTPLARRVQIVSAIYGLRVRRAERPPTSLARRAAWLIKTSP